MKKSDFWFVVVLSLAGFFLYLPVVKAGFLYDDYTVIVDNPGLRSPSFLTAIAAVGGGAIRKDMFRPLSMLSYYLDYKIWGLNPWGYRICNVFLGIINSYLLYLLLLAIFPGGDKRIIRALALLFLVLPLNNQALFYITARFTLLFSLFFLLGFYSYIKNRPFISGIFFFLGLLCKEEMLIFPLVVLVYELVSDRNFKYYLSSLLSYFSGMVIFLGLRFFFLKFPGWDRSYAGFNWKFLPPQLGFFLYNWKPGFSSPVVMHDLRGLNLYPFYLLVVVIILAGVYLIVTKNKLGAVLIYPWMVIFSWVPFLNGPHRAMEYRFYLANTFYILLLVTILKKITPKLGLKIAVVLIAISFWFSIFRAMEYRDNLLLWANTTARYPGLSEAHVNYGRELSTRRLYQRGIEEFKKAIELAPRDYLAFYNLGLAYAYIQDYPRALRAFLMVTRIAPGYAPGHYNLGLTYLILGDKIKAHKELDKARRLGWEVKIPEIEDGKD